MIPRIVPAAVAVAAVFAALTAQAQAPAYYTAMPLTKVEKTRLITRSTLWAQHNGVFVAARAPERDAVLCQLVSREVGGLSSFSVGGKAYDPAQLDRCNGKARPSASGVGAD